MSDYDFPYDHAQWLYDNIFAVRPPVRSPDICHCKRCSHCGGVLPNHEFKVGWHDATPTC